MQLDKTYELNILLLPRFIAIVAQQACYYGRHSLQNVGKEDGRHCTRSLIVGRTLNVDLDRAMVIILNKGTTIK